MSQDEPPLDHHHLFRTIAIVGSDGEKNLRTIQPISQEDYDSYEKPGIRLTGPALKEIEWFADDRRTIAGVLSHYRPDDDWGFVVARRNEHRIFDAVEVKAGIKDRDTARARLLKTMADFVKHWAGRREKDPVPHIETRLPGSADSGKARRVSGTFSSLYGALR